MTTKTDQDVAGRHNLFLLSVILLEMVVLFSLFSGSPSFLLIVVSVIGILGFVLLPPKKALIALIILAPFATPAGTVGVGKAIFYAFFFLTFVLLAKVLFAWFLQHRCVSFHLPLVLPVFAYLGLGALSFLYAASISQVIYELKNLIGLVVFAYLVVNLTDRREDVHNVVFSLFAVGFFLSLIGILQGLLSTTYTKMQIFATIFRAGSVFKDPNFFGRFIVILLMLGISLYVPRMREKKMIPLGVFVAVTFAALLFTYSRSAWIAFIFGLITVVAFLRIPLSKKLAFGLISIILLGALFQGVPVLKMRVLSLLDVTGDPSLFQRFLMARSGIEMIRIHPIRGVGLANFPVVYPNFRHPLAHPYIVASHNWVVGVTSELGLIGLSLVIWLFILYTREVAGSIKSLRDLFLRDIQVGLLASFIVFYVHGLFYAFFFRRPFFWVVFGLSLALARLDKRQYLRT